MKKILIVILLVCISFLFACNSVQSKQTSDNGKNAFNTKIENLQIEKRERVSVTLQEGETVDLEELLKGYSKMSESENNIINGYDITYSKYIGKYPTADTIRVCYNNDGSVHSYHISTHKFSGNEYTEEELNNYFSKEDNMATKYREYLELELKIEMIGDNDGEPIPIRYYIGRIINGDPKIAYPLYPICYDLKNDKEIDIHDIESIMD